MQIIIDPAPPDVAHLEAFLRDRCHRVRGRTIKFSEFAAAFRSSLPLCARVKWTNIRLSRSLRHDCGIAVGGLNQNARHLANLSWTPARPMPFSYAQLETDYGHRRLVKV